jgi:hypothetical protein
MPEEEAEIPQKKPHFLGICDRFEVNYSTYFTYLSGLKLKDCFNSSQGFKIHINRRVSGRTNSRKTEYYSHQY